MQFDDEALHAVFIEAANIRSFGLGDKSLAAFLARHGELPNDKPTKRYVDAARVWKAQLSHLWALLGLWSSASEEIWLQRGDELRARVRDGINAHIGGLTPQLDASLRITAQPSNLIDAVWLGFARAVALDRQFARCAVCGAFIELATRAHRSPQMYCSNSCKLRAYRARKKAGELEDLRKQMVERGRKRLSKKQEKPS